MNFKHELLHLLKTHSYQKKKVTLASGRESDFFIDCKQTVLMAQAHVLVGELMHAAIVASPSCKHVRAVAGVELGGCSLASAVSMHSAKTGQQFDAFYVRKDAKDHGSKRLIEGDTHLPKCDVVILEDVITTGGSTLKAIAKLHEAGHTVKRVIALVDREEGGCEAIANAGHEVQAIFLRRDFL